MPTETVEPPKPVERFRIELMERNGQHRIIVAHETSNPPHHFALNEDSIGGALHNAATAIQKRLWQLQQRNDKSFGNPNIPSTVLCQKQ